MTPAPLVLADLLDIVDAALATLSRRLPTHVGRDDLASVGKLALIAAAAQCHGAPDEVRAYCYVRVRGAMLDELRRLDPLSRRQRAQAVAVAQAHAVLGARLGRAPTTQELAAETKLTVDQIEAVKAAAAQAAGDAEIDLHSFADPEANSPAESVEVADLCASLRLALDRLPTNQALAVRRYYLEDATLDDIAAELGVSRERARQVREAGEKKLRADFIVLALWQSFIARGPE